MIVETKGMIMLTAQGDSPAVHLGGNKREPIGQFRELSFYLCQHSAG